MHQPLPYILAALQKKEAKRPINPIEPDAATFHRCGARQAGKACGSSPFLTAPRDEIRNLAPKAGNLKRLVAVLENAPRTFYLPARLKQSYRS